MACKINMALTEKQAQIYDFAVAYTNKHGYSPTFQDIMNQFNISNRRTVTNHYRALQKKSYIAAGRFWF